MFIAVRALCMIKRDYRKMFFFLLTETFIGQPQNDKNKTRTFDVFVFAQYFQTKQKKS